MIKVSGVNFWPSQLESILLKEEAFGPQYRIKISRVSPSTDKMTVEVESREKILDVGKKEILSKKLARDLHDSLLFSPEVVILDPNTLPRVEVGKAVRVTDERNSRE